jgi:surface polysaccharide O-acyltransferase-like enzyme
VPLFVMLSGALLLRPAGPTTSSRPGRPATTAAFYRRRLVRVGVPALFWLAAYFVFRRWYLGEPLSLGAYLHLVVRGIPYSHLYFLFVILGLYAVTPALRALLARSTTRQAWALALVAVALAWANDVLAWWTSPGWDLAALTWWLPYVGYFLLGALLRDVRLPRWSGRVAVLVLAVGVAAKVALAWELQGRYGVALGQYELGKLTLLTVAMSVAAFVAFRRLGDRRPRLVAARPWRPLAEASFGVYLVHPMVLAVLLRTAVGGGAVRTTSAAVAAFVLTLVLTYGVVLAARRAPLVRRVL